MANPAIEVTHHAHGRMELRGITWQMVQDALLRPESIRPNANEHGRLDAVKTYKGRRYRVVFSRPSPNKIVVHTVY